MTTTTLGSMLLGSSRPEELRAWYRRVFAPDHDGDGPIELGGVMLLIEGRDDVAPATIEPGRVILNLHVEDAYAAEQRLRGLGVEWLVPVEDRTDAKIGTFLDPDGNYLQVVELAADHQPA